MFRPWVGMLVSGILLACAVRPARDASSPVAAANATTRSRVDATIRELEDRRRVAYEQFDTTALGPLLAPEYYVSASELGGRVADRAGALNVIERTRTTHDPYRLTIDSLSVRSYGDAAVSMGQHTHHMMPRGGQPFDVVDRFTHVWVRRDGRWLLVARQVSRVPQ